MKLQALATIIMVICLVIAAVNIGTTLAAPIGRLVAPQSVPLEIAIISIYAPGELFPGNSWIMDYIRDGETKSIYAPSSEHMDRILAMWEEQGIEVKWIGAAE